ncbi:MAG: hypothetical protein HQ494_12235 [Rhodospirillales bacterium]|nr:hypothetical protein [Rhodospirillales bacterium]
MNSSVGAEEAKGLIPGDFTSNFGVFSNYTFRGISQTGDEPAIQGGIDYSIGLNKDVSLYLGVWGSNVDFSDSDDASVEMDWYGGFSGAYKGVDVSLGVIYYSYPGALDSANYDFFEGNIALGYAINDKVSLGFGYNGTSENFGKSGSAHYFNGSVSYAVPISAVDLTFDANIGHQSIEKEAVFGVPDYWDWKIGASLALTKNIALNAFYTDTDITATECGSENCDARGQLSLTASF